MEMIERPAGAGQDIVVEGAPRRNHDHEKTGLPIHDRRNSEVREQHGQRDEHHDAAKHDDK